MPHHLVGAAEIGRMLGVSRQRVDQLTHEEGFPAPEVTLTAGRVWSREAVIAWARAERREVVEPYPSGDQ
jgi:predicted DNA-binding transcriptional regulator AlpA